jgi:hypothetical protein
VTLAPRVVLVHRHTELEELLARHGTRGQAAFYLRTRGRRLEDLDARHSEQAAAMVEVSSGIPPTGGGAWSSEPTCPGSCSARTTSW